MTKLNDIERSIDRKLRSLLRSSSVDAKTPEPLEVRRAIFEEVDGRVDVLPRGKRRFSFSQVSVRILVPQAAMRRSYEIAFCEANALARDLREHLREQRVELPARFSAAVELVSELPPDIASRGFDVSYGDAAQADHAGFTLTVLAGEAASASYRLERKRANLGRLEEVLDSEQQVIRNNDVAFLDNATELNASVSRQHAHIQFDDELREFRLVDDGSRTGTSIVRDGEMHRVPSGPGKGVVLRDGDEIRLGKARLRFELAR